MKRVGYFKVFQKQNENRFTMQVRPNAVKVS